MEFVGESVVSKGVCERRFDVEADGRTIPGILWSSEGAAGTRPLVLIGHGGNQHKRSPNVLALARRLVRHHDFAAAAIDGPVHGDRAPEGLEPTTDPLGGGLRNMPAEEVRHLFRLMRTDWATTLTELKALDEVGDGPTGYWGLSMGTVIGLPYVASEVRIDAAVLGLMGLAPDARGGSARSIKIPILFLVQWDDEIVRRTNALTLFDTLGTTDKTMHVNPGLHSSVPPEEFNATERFFAKHLGALEAV